MGMPVQALHDLNERWSSHGCSTRADLNAKGVVECKEKKATTESSASMTALMRVLLLLLSKQKVVMTFEMLQVLM